MLHSRFAVPGALLGALLASPAIADDHATLIVEGVEDAPAPTAGWSLEPGGYVRASWESVQDDPDLDFVGRNDGFVVNNARVGLEGAHAPSGLSFAISVEGAADLRDGLNTPSGEMVVRLRDAFVRYDPVEYVGVQAGQFKLPFAGEDLRSTADLLLPSRSVGSEGVLVGRGLELEGLDQDRQIGAMLSTPEPIYVGPIGFAAYVAATNGNGSNEIANDNGGFAVAARFEVHAVEAVRVGVAYLQNQRTEGDLPNLVDETDTGLTADLEVRLGELDLSDWADVELFVGWQQLTTAFDTIGTPDRVQSAMHAEIGYRFAALPVPITPAYRYATFDPWADGGSEATGINLESLGLTYHTIGLRVEHPSDAVDVALFIAHTLTGEDDERTLENDRTQVLVQAVF